MRRALASAAAFLAVIPLTLTGAGFSPETGSLVVQRYAPEQYAAAPQNWAVVQDRRGILYFGNDSGVLEFDGLSWKLFPLSNDSRVRSVAIDDEGTVYAGGQGDFGFLRPDATGTLQFVSLLSRVPLGDRKFNDLWRILPTPQGVYFSSYERLFRLEKDGSIRVWRPVSNFGRAFYVFNNLYVKTRERGLLRMQGDNLTPVPGGAIFANVPVTDAVSFDDGALIASRSGLYRLDANRIQPFPTTADSWFALSQLYTLRLLPDGEIAAGTVNGGVALLSRQGTLDRILTKSEGLSDNAINSIFADSQGGVWLTGDSGLTRVNTGLSQLEQSQNAAGKILCMSRQAGTLYVGATAGLFRVGTAGVAPPRFERVEGMDATVWALLPVGPELLAATDTGIYSVTGKRSRKVLESRQPIVDLSQSAHDPDTIYAAGRSNAHMLKKAANGWQVRGEFVDPGREFLTIMEDDAGSVWATGRDTIWRIDFSEQPATSTRFGATEGVPPGVVNARRLQGHVTFATSKGLRRYSEVSRRFAPDISLGTQFVDGSRDVYNLFEAPHGDVWITGEKYHGVFLRQTDGTYKYLPEPLLAAGITEIYGASLDDDGTIWATGAKGVLYRWERPLAGDPDNGFNVLTRAIFKRGKDVVYGGSGPFESMRFPWSDNDLRFRFAAPFYEDPAAVEYQSRLEGSDREWSAWSHETTRDYTHLEEGSYRFQVRARTPHGGFSEQSSIAFGVLPPWYRTWWAYSLFAVVAGLAVWQIVRFRTRQLEEDKRKLEVIVEERTVEVRQQRDEIRVQERKSHSLLLNILPAQVADELKNTGSVKPVGFDDVTVCFTDFVGFTLSSEKLAPGHLVDALNEYFTRFDEIVARYGLEKLKTIGDSYMFVSGLPAPRTSHAVDAVLAALEMVEVVKELGVKPGGTGWNIRVGLHSGPVVAGVVGIRKFAFDIWGNTVNFAARMESSGVPGRVNMSEKTCRLTRDLILCEARGKVKIKEGRELPMFLANGAFTADPAAFAARYREEFSEEPTAFPNVELRADQSRSAATVS